MNLFRHSRRSLPSTPIGGRNDGRGWGRAMLLAASLLFLPVAHAAEAVSVGEDPAIEQRMVKLSEELRCLVCQNESLAGSHAELAEDLRREIRVQMKAGKNDKEVIEYLTTRYGDFVLYRPPFKPLTYLLWLGPLLFLGIGGSVWYVTLKKRRDQKDSPVDEKQLTAAAQLLDEKQ
ncbi:MAG: cytochrome c-type biogenesis protein CcmH [Pseudomonadota bacterium]|nr:cytochrome c-type biogenesis protein CcmH [Pseudomonadota bacterium]